MLDPMVVAASARRRHAPDACRLTLTSYRQALGSGRCSPLPQSSRNSMSPNHRWPGPSQCQSSCTRDGAAIPTNCQVQRTLPHNRHEMRSGPPCSGHLAM
jgi:hypothetical protein